LFDPFFIDFFVAVYSEAKFLAVKELKLFACGKPSKAQIFLNFTIDYLK